MATGRDLRARLVLGLRDEASAGLERINGRLSSIGGALRRLGTAAAVIAGINFLGPAQSAAQFDDTLRQNAITAGLTGQALEAMIRRNGRAFEQLALQTGQTSQAVAEAAGSMIAAGMDPAMIDRLLPTIARVATGTDARMTDLATTAFQLQQQLGITAEQMPAAFASLIQAGRDGNFELRDMAREFPEILTAARALGMQGPGAVHALSAALQIAQTSAGGSTTAANNLLNALQKIASPETVRNFREIGVNLEGVLQDAARRGINPLEAIVQKLRERTGGNLFRLQELFGDRQALMGLLPMIQQVDRYLETRDRAATAPVGLIDQAMADRLRGARMQMAQVGEAMTQLSRRFQLAAGVGLPYLVDGLQRLLGWLNEVEQKSPGLIETITFWPGVFILAAAALGILGGALSLLGAGITIALAPVTLLAGLIGGTAAAIVVGVALIAGAAYLLWRNWGRVGPWFRTLWEAVKGYFNWFVEWVSGWGRAAMGRAVEVLQVVWLALRTWFGTLFNTWIAPIFRAFGRWIFGWTDEEMDGAVEAIKSKWEGLRTFFGNLWDGIVEVMRAKIAPIIALFEWLERMNTLLTGRADGEANPNLGEDAQRRRRENWGRRGNTAPGDRPAEDALPKATSSSAPRVAGEILVRAAPGTEIVETRVSEGSVAITAPRGATRDRP